MAWAFDRLTTDRDRFQQEAWGQYAACRDAHKTNASLRKELEAARRYTHPAPLTRSLLKVYVLDEGSKRVFYSDNDRNTKWMSEPEQANIAGSYNELFSANCIPASQADTLDRARWTATVQTTLYVDQVLDMDRKS